jgi:predicted Zn-dependent protease
MIFTSCKLIIYPLILTDKITNCTCMLVLCVLLTQCKKENMGLISREQEIEMGRKADSVIASSPEQFPVLDTALYHNAYAYLDTMLSEILQSNDLQRKNVFSYQVKIIDRDILHAFASPGGCLYFYTGLIKMLDNGAQFAGVLAHLMVHIDRRHITCNLEAKYHIDQLLSVIWGDNSTVLAEITGYLTGESGTATYSNAQEYEADEYAVRCLADTDYDPRGVLYFFTRLNQLAQAGMDPEFLNTHADPGNRLESIERIWEDLGSPEGDLFTSEYNNLKLSLAGD